MDRLARKCGLAIAITIGTLLAPLAVGRDDIGSLRFLSFALRDQGLTPDEAKAFFASSQSLDQFMAAWRSSPEHAARVQRFFGDLFGVKASVTVTETAFVLTEQDGVYSNDTIGWCDSSQGVDATGWWGEGSQSASLRVCPAVLNAPTAGRNGGSCWTSGKCGCGPNLYYCIPKALVDPLRAAVRTEAAQRGLYAYQQDKSWRDFLAGDRFYGNRLLFWYYLATQKLWTGTLENLSSDDAATLARLPLNSNGEAAFPSGAERAGVITSPGFLLEFNNYRSRIRWLSQTLLCQDVNPALNTDNYTNLVNKDLSAADKAHGLKPSCSGCHYPLDNMGSGLLRWNDQALLGTVKPKSDATYAFGKSGSGPAFLMTAFIERGPGFSTCMAKTAWESFSGIAWTNVGSDLQKTFTDAAASGPKALLSAIFGSDALKSARLGGSAQSQLASAPARRNFEGVKAILTNSCGGGDCHSKGAPHSAFTDSADTFAATADVIAARITVTGAGKMPPAPRSLSDSDRDRILKAINP